MSGDTDRNFHWTGGGYIVDQIVQRRSPSNGSEGLRLPEAGTVSADIVNTF